MPLGTEAGLGPGDFVLDGDPAPPPQKAGGAPSPISGPCLLCQMAGWINMAVGMQVGLGPGLIVVDGDPATLLKKGAEPPPNFRPISIVAKRLDVPRCHLVRR